MMRSRRISLTPILVAALIVSGSLAGCSDSSTTATSTASTTTTLAESSTTTTAKVAVAGMPPVVTPGNVYSEIAADKPLAGPAGAKAYVYVPDNDDGMVWVIDQATYEVAGKYSVGKLVQHVVPSHDASVLYANASASNQLVPFDPMTGTPGTPIAVDAPYNLYFSPDGQFGIVMAERRNHIDFYSQPDWKKVDTIEVPCTGRGSAGGTVKSGGVNHADWSADGSYFIATCEFSGELLKIDTATHKITATLSLGTSAMPQDCRVGPDGHTFFVADMMAGGVHVIDGDAFTKTAFITTGDGAHGIYPSRDAKHLYVSNRGHTGMGHAGGGTVSLIDVATQKVSSTWTIPGGGSPDMGGVSADGTKLWLSGRYDNVVYVFDTTTGEMIKKIPVGKGPHGLAIFPQPGRYSLGHTGNYR